MSNTQNVRKGEELNENTIKLFLYQNDLIKTTTSDIEIRQFSGGYSNLTYLLQVEEKEYVLRRPPLGAVKRGHDMHREYRVQRDLKKAFGQVPQVYAYSDDESILGAPFYIMEKVNGAILTAAEARKRNIAAADFSVIADTWLDTLVALHHIDYQAIGLSDLGKPDGYVERQVFNWAKQYEKAATDDIAEALKVINWITENQPKEYRKALIHNDFKYDNVVFEADTEGGANWQKIVAVLDWEMCTIGDPLMDLGTSLSYWTMATDEDFVKKVLNSPTVLEGNPSRIQIVERYVQKTRQDVPHLIFYYAFGLFKLAVISQQIYYRYKKGFTSDPRFAQLNIATDLCLKNAWKAIQTGTL